MSHSNLKISWVSPNPSFKAKFGEDFTTNLVQSSGSLKLGIQHKRSRTDIKEEKRKLCRQIRDDMNEQLSQSVPLGILAENQSIAGYKRQRLFWVEATEKNQKSFTCKLPELEHRRPNSWPGFFAIWNKNNLATISSKAWYYWSNRRQICKEYVINHGTIDLSKFTFATPITPSRRQHVSRKRLSGGEVSCPVPPTSNKVKKKWNEMMENGTLSLGVPCVPFTITRLKVKNGSLYEDKIAVYGRKILLLELRKKLLQQHEVTNWWRAGTNVD